MKSDREFRLHFIAAGFIAQMTMFPVEGRMVEMSHPWRRRAKLLATAFNGIGTLSDRLKLAKLRWHVTHTSIDDLWQKPESTTEEYLRTTCGLSSDMVDRFFRPWFSCVFLETDLTTSSRFFGFLFRMFAMGDASFPKEGMGAIPRQLAARLPPSMIRLSAPIDSLVDDHRLRLKSGEYIDCRPIVLAVEGPEASRLTGGMIRSPAGRATTCFYYGAPQPPFGESLLVLNGDHHGPINNLCVVSNVAKTYAPAGQSLISVSVVGEPESGSDDAENGVRRQLREWFGASVDSWSLLKRYNIPYALPSQPAHFRDGIPMPLRLVEGVYHCGEYSDTGSIQGAMMSGRKNWCSSDSRSFRNAFELRLLC